jgi:hypothetical protein
MRDVPGLEILNRRADDPLILTGVDGVTVNAVVCWRSEEGNVVGKVLDTLPR